MRDPPHTLRIAARRARWRRWHERHKQGRALLQIEVDPHAIADALIDSARLTAEQTGSRRMVQQALADVVAEWAARWCKRVGFPPPERRR
jgi:hypothetical protein